jgi:hypothetical protein
LTKQTPKKKVKLTVAGVDAQLNKAFGNISAVAAAFGVTRSAVYDYIKRHPSLKRTMDDARERLIDDAESALHAAVLSKEGWAVCFTLKTIGKDRGYVEKRQIEHSGKIDVTKLTDEELDAIIEDEGESRA